MNGSGSAWASRWRAGSLALVAWMLTALASIPAVAQEVPDVGETIETLPTPTPDLEENVGTVNDTIASLDEKKPPRTDGAETGPTGDGGGDGTDGGDDTRNGDAPSGGGRRAGASSATIVTRGAGEDPSNAAGSGSGDADEPYASLAARGTVAAAGRALKMAGPLAPALGLAVVALFVVFGLSRGSAKLVKIDDAAGGDRTYRL
jgi:hypothetical protein